MVEVLRKIVVDRCLFAEIDVPGMGQRAGAVGPGAHQQSDRAFLRTGKRHEIIGGRPGIRVVPGAHVHLRHVGKHIVVFLSAEADLLPVVVEVFPSPDIQQIVFVVGRPLQRRVSLLPGQPVEPAKDVLGFKRRLDCLRECICLAAFDGLFVGPGQLPEFKGATVAAGVEEGVGEPTRIQPHTTQVRRVQTRRRRLGVRRVGQAIGADLAAVPGLLRQPSQCIEPVLALIDVLGELSLGFVTCPAVLHHRDIAVGGEEYRFLDQVWPRFAVRRALEQDRENRVDGQPGFGGTVDIGRQKYAVAHGGYDVGFGMDFV